MNKLIKLASIEYHIGAFNIWRDQKEIATSVEMGKALDQLIILCERNKKLEEALEWAEETIQVGVDLRKDPLNESLQIVHDQFVKRYYTEYPAMLEKKEN